MIEDKLSSLLPTETITNNIDMIIDAFVDYYGEDKREEITKKFKNILILKFTSLTDLKKLVNDVKLALFREIYNIPDKDYVHLNVDDLVTALQSGNIKSLYISSGTKKIITANGNIDNLELYKNYKNGLYPQLEELVKRYPEVNSKVAQFDGQIQKEESKKIQIAKKYHNKLIEEFKHVLPPESLENYTKGYPDPILVGYFSYSLNKDGHCFDENNEKILNDPTSDDWKKESILSDRCYFMRKFFPVLEGMEEPTYKDYLANSETREFISKTIEICSRISRRKIELYNEMVNEQIENLDDYRECRRIVDEMNFVDKGDPLGPFVYTGPISCYSDNFVKTENGYALRPMILLNSGTPELDETLIHELNHAYETFILGVDETGCLSICGWDYTKTVFQSRKDKIGERYQGISRGYELMNEYINDRIAQEITDKMHSKGNIIFCNTKNKSSSSYLIVKFLLEDFFQEFKEVIIKSRSNNNIQYIYDTVGKENFEELNNLINEFYNNFGFSIKAQMCLADYYEHKENDNTKKICDLIERKNEIMERMRSKAYDTSMQINM